MAFLLNENAFSYKFGTLHKHRAGSEQINRTYQKVNKRLNRIVFGLSGTIYIVNITDN